MSDNIKMYLPLVLLLAFVESFHGEMIQCFVGGIIYGQTSSDKHSDLLSLKQREEYCNEMSKDTLNIDIPICIVDYWNDIVNMGTDMHILKFYNKLVTIYKNGYKFSKQEGMVFLMSNYSAVGIYYFTNNILVARCVAKDGLYILKAIGKYSDNNNTETDKIEFLMWDIIIPSTYVEMYHSDYSIDNNLPLIKHRLTNSLEKLDQLISNGVEYPCSYLLMYRSLLLDKNQQQYFGGELWTKLATLIYDGSITICETHLDNRKLQMYTNLISSVYDPESEAIKGLTSFNHLKNALQLPVFTSEDRLLNYKATSLAMKKISNCVDENGWKITTDDDFCKILRTNRRNDLDLDDLLTKLTYMQIYRMTNADFKPNFIHEDRIIESKMRMIVTMAIDNVDNTSYIPLKRIEIVKYSITKLNEYIQKQIAKKVELEPTNIMLAYKWLVELYGVLCTDSKKIADIKLYQKNLEETLKKAIALQKKYNIKDDHLEFLLYKKICKDSFDSFSWERKYKADGWIQNTPRFYKKLFRHSTFHKYDCGKISKFLNINNPFIHQADLNIIMFKQLIIRNTNSSVLKYLQNALSHKVVSSEDRVRNLQAHELYCMYIGNENSKTIKDQGS